MFSASGDEAPIPTFFVPKTRFNISVEINKETEQDTPWARAELRGNAIAILGRDPFEVRLAEQQVTRVGVGGSSRLDVGLFLVSEKNREHVIVGETCGGIRDKCGSPLGCGDRADDEVLGR